MVSHIVKTRVDYDVALQQWHAYCDAFRNHNWKVVRAPNPNEENDCPDSVFIEDCFVMFKSPESGECCAVITRPGHPSRAKETSNIESFLRQSARIGTVQTIEHPGTFDGGDVLKVGNTVYVGRSARTNSSGIQQFEKFLRPYGARVVPIPLSKVLHLKSVATALPCGTIIAWRDALDDEAVGIFRNTSGKELLFSPEENGSHVVILDEHTVLMSHAAPKTAALLGSPPYNLRVICVNIDEFIKLEGCVTCLSVRIR